MKNYLLLSTLVVFTATGIAQQNWTTNRITIPSTSNADLGITNKKPIKLFTSDTTRMEIGANGEITLNKFIDSEVNWDRPVVISPLGKIKALGTAYTSSPCVANGMPWFEGGNMIVGAANRQIIGPCNNRDFILQANNTPMLFLTATNNWVGIGAGNSNPTAVLDITGAPGHKMTFSGDWNGIIQTTQDMNLEYAVNFNIMQNGQPKLVITNGQGVEIPSSLTLLSGSGPGLITRSGANSATAISVYNTLNAEETFVVQGDGKTIIGLQKIASGPHFGAMLTVGGKIVGKEMIVTQQDWADFVFDKTYRLPSLESVEEFYSKHGHLEFIPSEHEVKSQGLNLGEINKLLLMKIEETTLYLVQLNKALEQQRKEVSDLKKKLETLDRQNN